MSSRSSVSEAAYLGMITVVVLTIAIIVTGEINHFNRPLWRGQDLPHGGEIVVGIKDFPVPRARPRKQVGVAGRRPVASESDSHSSTPARPS
jgi:hypothetical protein